MKYYVDIFEYHRKSGTARASVEPKSFDSKVEAELFVEEFNTENQFDGQYYWAASSRIRTEI